MKKYILILLLAGCSQIPEYERPSVDTPAQWAGNAKVEQPTAIAGNWWAAFNSAELNELMNQALAGNNDLLAGVQRVAQARASLKVTNAALVPNAGISGDASRSRNNPISGETETGNNLQLSGNVSYELDLFGANRAASEAGQAGINAAQYDLEALKLVVIGDVASNYFTLVNLRERLQIADTNLANIKEVLRIVTARYNAGSASQLEVSQQQSAVSNAEAARASLVEQASNIQNALAVLLGRAPQNINVATQSLNNLAVPHIQPSQPSSFVERRPDIRSAEAGLVAANANIGIARAAYFPSISLGAGVGLSSTGITNPAASALSLASSLTAPIFSGGRLEGGVELQTARQKELVETYRKTILTSFQEVEDALAGITSAQTREATLQSSAQNAQEAYRVAKTRYDNGSIDFQTLLDTQNALLSAQDNAAQAHLARLNNAVTLFKALGGGWNGRVD